MPPAQKGLQDGLNIALDEQGPRRVVPSEMVTSGWAKWPTSMSKRPAEVST